MSEDAALGSEAEAIAILRGEFRQARGVRIGIGDDAAVLDAPVGGLVVSTDMLVEGVDFDTAWASWGDIGWKAVAVNVSDMAAMGAEPTGLVLGLGVPPSLTGFALRELARGAQAGLDRFAPAASIVGGDISSAPVLTLSVTVLGSVPDGGPTVRRSGAKAGDRVAYAGQLGQAAAGLALLQRGVDGDAGNERHARARQAQLRPVPLVSSGRAARLSGASAMLDVSDGLAIDASRIAAASEVSIAFDPSAFPALVREIGWARFDLGLDPWQLLFAGGEDFALLATFPVDVSVPEGFVPLGDVVARGEQPVLLGDHAVDYVPWDHLAAHPAKDL